MVGTIVNDNNLSLIPSERQTGDAADRGPQHVCRLIVIGNDETHERSYHVVASIVGECR